jgi:hypothetical protein
MRIREGAWVLEAVSERSIKPDMCSPDAANDWRPAADDLKRYCEHRADVAVGNVIAQCSASRPGEVGYETQIRSEEKYSENDPRVAAASIEKHS